MQTISLHPKLLLFYSETTDGDMDDKYSPAKEVRVNRQNLFKSHNLVSREAIETAQIHSDRLLSLNSDNTKMWRGVKVTGVDGFITNQTDAILMVRVADCLPLIFYDPVHHAIGLFHAGWQGVVKGIHTTGLSRMTKEYSSDPKDLIVWLGPCARACHYRIDKKPDQAEDPAWKPYFSLDKNQYRVDLVGYVQDTLKSMGIKGSHIHDSQICTIESTNLFSHQRSLQDKSPEGRFVVVSKLL